MPALLIAENLSKTFVLHNQNIQLPVLYQQSLELQAGECLVLNGPSGSGKSSLLRSLYGNYLADSGSINILSEDGYIDICHAHPRKVVALRRNTIGWVSQFLRVIPRLPAIEVVMQPMLESGITEHHARDKAEYLLNHLNVSQRLWELPPATFSGGEQQRVNIAQGFALDYPILLLDEPTASLDDNNSAKVIELIQAAKQRGAGIVGIFHDSWVREQVADRIYTMQAITPKEKNRDYQ